MSLSINVFERPVTLSGILIKGKQEQVNIVLKNFAECLHCSMEIQYLHGCS